MISWLGTNIIQQAFIELPTTFKTTNGLKIISIKFCIHYIFIQIVSVLFHYTQENGSQFCH